MTIRAREREYEITIQKAEWAKQLLYDVLESIQQALGSEEYWQLDQLVERGVLGPARGFLVEAPGEDVRMSVLLPRDDDPTRWRMRWAAGHRYESVINFDRPIDDTMAGLAFRRGELVQSGRVRNDERFTPNPRETRPFATLVSVPLRVGEQIVGTLTTVSTHEEAFDEGDLSFIKLLGAVLDVLLALEHDLNRLGTPPEAEEEEHGG